MVTSRDVARLAGVSQTTVSRVLHESSLVSETTKARVMRALVETGYAPNAAARAMRTHRVGTIGVVISRITNPFYPHLIGLLGWKLAEQGLRLTLWDGEHPGEESALSAIRQGLVDGLLFTTATKESAALREALQREAPVLLFNRIVEGLSCDQVSSDNERSGECVAEFLIGRGHRRLAFIAGPRNASTTEERRRGITRVVDGRDDATLMIHEGEYSHEHGREALRAWMTLPSAARPTAIFCANDVIALGVIDEARALGVSIPGDMAVIGHDDIEMASWNVFDLTTVRQPIEDMVDAAVGLLLERIRGVDAAPRHLRFPSELVVRGSA